MKPSHKEQLERRIDQFNTIHGYKPKDPVLLKFISEEKPTNYFFNPHPLPELAHLSWFVEIWANDSCLFRESMTNQDECNLHEFEELLCARILLNSFIGSIYQQIEIREKYKTNYPPITFLPNH